MKQIQLFCIFLTDSCQIYICDFHREQAWERCLGKTSNGLVSSKQTVLGKLRFIAKARTEKDFEDRVEDLKSSNEWKENVNLRHWIEKGKICMTKS